jgi:hypothetical protein
MRKSSLVARLRRLRFGYASVTPETHVVTQLRDFLAFPIRARERFLKIFHVMKNNFCMSLHFKPCVTSVTA